MNILAGSNDDSLAAIGKGFNQGNKLTYHHVYWQSFFALRLMLMDGVCGIMRYKVG
jgi:hypothetical protein